MAVPEQTPYIEHTGNGVTTSFSLGFQCESKDHLIVLVDEIEPPVEMWSLIDENVVFTAAPTSGQKITLQRNTPFSRTTDYQSYNNSFRPPAVNNDFDRVWWKIQELGVRDWLLDLKIQKFRDDVNLTAMEETLEQAQSLRDDTAAFAVDVQNNVTQSQTLLANTTAQANAAAISATNANNSKDLAKQYADNIDASLTAIAGGHKAYGSLAAALANTSTFPMNSIVEITNDPDASKNGTYQWNGGDLTKSDYDPLTQAKADATTKANAAKAEAVSDAINSLYNVSSNRRDPYQLHDNEFNVLLSIDEKGNLLLPQSNMPVQNALGVYPELKTKTRLPQEGLQPIAAEIMSYLPFSGISYVPCPLGLQPQKYSINPADLGDLKVGVTTQVPLNTRFANDDMVVHPSIVEFYGGFRGYRYLLAITSYETASVENPSIFGSNDLETFEMLDGFVQPLAIPIVDGVTTSDFLSDVNLSYDPVNGLLVCLYRETATDPVLGAVTGVFARTTRNGYEWSEPFAISETESYSTGDKKISPSLIYNPTRKKWMLWVGTGAGMRLRTSDSLYGPWTIEHTKNYGRGIWHHEVRYVGGLFVMLTSNSEGGSNFEFLTSTDGENWTYRGNVLSENQSGIYKPSFVVNLNEDKTLNLDVLWTDNIIRKLFIGKTNSINYEVA